MPVLQYRILSPTLALFPLDGRTVARTVPSGSIIQIKSKACEDNKLVKAIWDGEEIIIFAQVERGDKRREDSKEAERSE